MNSPSIPWFGPIVDEAEKAALADVISSGYINDGAVTREFERRVAERIGVKHGVAVTSGTTAISMALMGMGIGPGDEVLVPDLTFIATANAVRLTGASVKLVDVEPDRFAIDPEQVRSAIGPNTRAIVPVDVNGRGADYKALNEICRQHDLVMVCDAAEALGSSHEGQALGSYGDAGCFSFSANKTVTCGQGGMITTNNTSLFERLLELKDQGRRVQGSGGNDLHPVIGYNFKLTNLQASIGLVQLDRLDVRLDQARARDAQFFQLLDGQNGIDISRMADTRESVLQWSDALFDDRESIEITLSSENIGCRPFWFPLHTQVPYQADANLFPVATEISAKGLWLPSHFDMTSDDIERTTEVICTAL